MFSFLQVSSNCLGLETSLKYSLDYYLCVIDRILLAKGPLLSGFSILLQILN